MRAGRSSSSPPGMSAKAERRFRALGAVVAKLFMDNTLAELEVACKGSRQTALGAVELAVPTSPCRLSTLWLPPDMFRAQPDRSVLQICVVKGILGKRFVDHILSLLNTGLIRLVSN